MSQKYVDEGLYDLRNKITLDHTLFEGDSNHRTEVMNKFFLDHINPDLGYPKLNKAGIDKKEKLIEELEEKLYSGDYLNFVKFAYRDVINELRNLLEMARCTLRGDDKFFTELGKIVYGEPVEESVRLVRATVGRFCSKVNDGSPMLLRAAAHKLAPLWQEADLIDFKEYLEKCGIPPEVDVSNEKLLTSEQVVQAFETALTENNYPYSVIVSDDARNISVKHKRKVVVIPNDDWIQIRRRPLTKTTLNGLIQHEVGVHIYRKMNGLESPLYLLSVGLAGYLTFEEGLATGAEYKVNGLDLPELQKHLAICLALGLLDGKSKDFSDTFSFMEAFCLLQTGVVTEESMQKAKDLAWCTSVRIFRGTTCKTPGGIYMKDVVYELGFLKVNHLYQNDPDLLKIALVGKCDPTLLNHRMVLEAMGLYHSYKSLHCQN